MLWQPLNHIRLLRYTGVFTLLCAGAPLLTEWWIASHMPAPQIALRSAAQALVREHSAPCEETGGGGHATGATACSPGEAAGDATVAPTAAATVNPLRPELSGWTLSYLIFGVAYLWLTSRLDTGRLLIRVAGLLLMTFAALGVGWFSRSGLSALLLVVIAMVLPWLLEWRLALAWMLGQHLLLGLLFVEELGLEVLPALLQVFTYLGISTLAFITSAIASQQAREREVQRQLNSELRSTRALLAESTRLAERMRIARELHDLIGHHLTALTLNLEVARHLTNDKAREHVGVAQRTAKLLLADVREAVSELRQDDAIDLTQALASLVDAVPGLTIHMDVPARFAVEDPLRAQALLRCVQEIVTNTARHANARHLWLSFAYADEHLIGLFARDDGRGVTALAPGNGLNGMRERLAAFGGTVDVDLSVPRGFALSIRLPLLQRQTPLAHAPDFSGQAALSWPSLPADEADIS
ncbi:sensor histidine kinase [Frateuria aurantia]